MFERYTERARRVIFFARYEASAEDSSYIESSHLLLGLVRENKEVLHRYLNPGVNAEEIRQAISGHTVVREPASAGVDLPLSNECKRILVYAAEEADRLGHKHIGTEHLLLGILREEPCFAARLLRERGLDIKKARALVKTSENEGTAAGATGSGSAWSSNRRPLSQRHPLPGIRIVEESNGEPLLTTPTLILLPCIGDAIRIPNAEGVTNTYRVRDVIYEFFADSESSSLKDIEVRVVKEDGV